jgi:hypothetical protein
MSRRHAYERRREYVERVARRADLLLGPRLERQGRAAGSYTEKEYVEALMEAADQIATLELESGPDMGALRRSPGGLEATAQRLEAVLATKGKTLSDVTDPDEYVARFAAAQAELYPEVDG